MNKTWRWSGFLVMVLGFLNMGVINKQEDPIAATQTSPIAYNDKMEELKDGQKEAPKPSYQFYAKEKFLVEPTVKNDREEPEESALPKVSEMTAPQPQETQPAEEVAPVPAEENEPVKTASGDDDWWADDTAQNSVKN